MKERRSVVVGMLASVRSSHAGLVCEGCNNDFWLCSLLFSQVRLASLFRREGVIAASCCKNTLSTRPAVMLSLRNPVVAPATSHYDAGSPSAVNKQCNQGRDSIASGRIGVCTLAENER